MRSDRKPSALMPVLRNVVVQDLPHALARPRRAAGYQREPERAAGGTGGAIERAPLVQPRSFDEGFAAGYLEGMSAGRSAQQAEAETMLEKSRAKALDEGRAEGLRRGKEEAAEAVRKLQAQLVEDAQAAFNERAERLDDVVRGLSAQSARLAEDAEDDLVAMSFEVVCRILGDRAATPVAVRGMVQHLLAQRSQVGLAVHLHPEDFEQLRSEEGVLSEAPGWTWVPDTKVKLGGLMLRSPQGSLDARLEVQLEVLRQTLLQARLERRPGHDVQARAPIAASEEAGR
jgi:flagellar assembly protein FliH